MRMTWQYRKVIDEMRSAKWQREERLISREQSLFFLLAKVPQSSNPIRQYQVHPQVSSEDPFFLSPVMVTVTAMKLLY